MGCKTTCCRCRNFSGRQPSLEHTLLFYKRNLIINLYATGRASSGEHFYAIDLNYYLRGLPEPAENPGEILQALLLRPQCIEKPLE